MTTHALPISETFTSIQGEGKLTGVPSFFIRLSGCNLRCRWCDTPYASWNPEGPKVSIDDLVRIAKESGGDERSAGRGSVRHAVLTGGEPMMFPGLIELSHRLRTEAGMHITIETAGTLIPDDGTGRAAACDLISISPKLANSTPHDDPRDPEGTWAIRHEQRRINLPVLQRLIDDHASPARQFKFVVSAQTDLAEIDALLAQLRGWIPDDILLMPEGIVTPAPALKSMVVQECLNRGWRYCSRLHIELFGNKRGT